LSGDEVLPDQTSLQLSTSGIGNFAFAEIVKGSKLYLQSGHGQWYVMDKPNTSDSSSSISNVLTSANITQFNKLLDQLSKNVQITDHGDESLNGTSLRHITIALDKNGLMQLIKNTDAFKKLPAASQQSANDALNSVGTFNASLDFWFDEATSYLHRFELKLNIAADLSKFSSPTTDTTSSTPSAFSLKADVTVDLSKFNDPSIKITAPANAVPTDNPGSIFSGASA